MIATRPSRRAFAVAGVLAVVASLTACGRSTESGADGPQAAPASVGAGAATGELTIWAQADEAAGLPAFADEFTKMNPGLKITVTPLPWDAAHNKYQTAIASGTTPDIAQMGTTWMSDFADAFAPAPKSFDPATFFGGSVKTNVVKQTQLGVPWYVDTRVFYYRKDLAQQAGYTEFPKTWDDFKAFTKALQTKAGAKYGVTLPASGGDSFQSMLMFPWSAGATLTNADGTKWTLDTPEWTRALDYYQSFFTEGIAKRDPDTGAGAAEAAFVNGSIPVMVAGPSGIGSIAKAGGGDAYKSKFAVGRVPADKSSTSFVGGSNLVVFKKSKNADAAWKFIQWMTTPEVQVRWQKAVGDLPAVKSAWDDPTLKNDPFLKVFGEQLDSTDAPPTLTTWTQVSAQADKALEQIVKAGVKPADALKALQSQADSIGAGA
jgi:multiple sugar transport system substrate-binding protein